MKKVITAILTIGLSSTIFADNPCEGPTALLNIANRPSAADSACAAPFKKAIIESGYQYQELTHSAGQQQNFPQATFRLGLPDHNEFVIDLPNYIHQSKVPQSGFTATNIGIKHQFKATETLVTAIEGVFTVPSGSAAYGSQGTGFTFNGIMSYSITPDFGFAFMLGGATLTESSSSGGGRYNTINPDLILTYAITSKLNVYGELYGQTKTGPNTGSGYNSDAGFIYLLKPNLTVDIEIGQRISGTLSNFNQYLGAGLAWMF